MARKLSYLILGLLIGLTTGCGQPYHLRQQEQDREQQEDAGPAGLAVEESVAVDPDQLVFATPQECFTAYQQALNDGDTETVLQCLSPIDRKQRIGWYAYYIDREVFYERENAEAAQALMAEHDIKEGTVMEYVHRKAEAPIKETLTVIAQIASNIERPTEFAVAASKLVTITIGGLDSHDDTRFQLKDVDIRGDFATGTVVDPETGESDKVYFQRYAGGTWLITTGL